MHVQLSSALPYCMNAWSTQGMKNPSPRQLGMLHLSQEGLLAHRAALTGSARTENCTWGYFPRDGKGALLNKARLQASQHTTALAIKLASEPHVIVP